MSAMGAIYGNIWEFIENKNLDELSDCIGGFNVEFERYTNRPTNRDFILVNFYKNGVYQDGMSAQYWLDEFYATYRH